MRNVFEHQMDWDHQKLERDRLNREFAKQEAKRKANMPIRYHTAFDDIQKRIDVLRKREQDLLEEQLKLELLPKEPNTTEDGTNSILFKILFTTHGVYYAYVATYIEDQDRWYVSGPNSRNNGGFTWDEMVKWITSAGVKGEIWHVTTYELLAQS